MGAVAVGYLWSYIVYNLRKQWYKRAPVFLTYGFTLWDGLTLFQSILLRLLAFLIITAVWLLVDEKIKEGYFFDPSDLGRLTHETLTVIVLPIILPLALYLRKRNNIRNTGDTEPNQESTRNP